MHAFLQPFFQTYSIFFQFMSPCDTAIAKPQPGSCFFDKMGMFMQQVQGELLFILID